MTMSDDKIQDDYNLDAEGFFPCGPGDQRTCWIAGPRGPEDLVNTMDNCRSWGVGVSQGHYSRNSHLLRVNFISISNWCFGMELVLCSPVSPQDSAFLYEMNVERT
jgi:hypothetical protein